MAKNNELVMCFPDNILWEWNIPISDELHSLFIKPEEFALDKIIPQDKLSFVARGLCEDNDQLRQVIPYNLIAKGNLILAYQRASKGGDARLQSKWSIGIGGHISVADVILDEKEVGVDVVQTINYACKREIEEEIGWEPTQPTSGLGFIRMGATPVDRVHFGIAQLWELPNGVDLKISSEIAHFGFMSPEEIDKLDLELWSRSILDKFVKK